MNILITGGNGLIGKSVSEMLNTKKNKVFSFDKIKNKNKNKKYIYYIKGNILNTKLINNVVKKNNIDVVLHFAANLGVKKTESNALDCLTVNIEGTKNILSACVKNNVKKLIFASSSEVYGNGNKRPITETSELMPKSSYGVSKVVGESYLKSYFEKYGLKYNILRFFNVYGPDQRDDFVVSKFKKNIKNKKPIKIYGSGNQVRSFCHVHDAARAVCIIISKGKKNQIYNVGNDNEPIKIKDLAKKMINISKRKIKTINVPFNKSDRSLSREIFIRQPSIRKIRQHTHYSPVVNLTKGIISVLNKN